jgi:hypothetical protein
MLGSLHLLDGLDLVSSHEPEFLHLLYSVARIVCTEPIHLRSMNGWGTDVSHAGVRLP